MRYLRKKMFLCLMISSLLMFASHKNMIFNLNQDFDYWVQFSRRLKQSETMGVLKNYDWTQNEKLQDKKADQR